MFKSEVKPKQTNCHFFSEILGRVYQMERGGHRDEAVRLLIMRLKECGDGWYQSFLTALHEAGYCYFYNNMYRIMTKKLVIPESENT